MKKLNRLKSILSRPQSIAAGTVSIMIFTILSKGLGFIREMVLAANFGTSWRMDALIVAMDPAQKIGGIISGAIATMFVPVYLSHKKDNNKEALNDYTTRILFISSVLLISFGVVLTLFPEFFIGLFAPNFGLREKAYAVRKMRITGLLPLVNGFTSLVTSLLKAEKQFMLSSSIQLVYNIISIPLIMLTAPLFGEASYLFAFVTGMGVMDIVYLYVIRRNIQLRSIKRIFSPAVLETLRLALPLMISSGIGTINTIVDKAFASSLQSGSITSLRMAQSINSMITTIIIGSLMTTVFTELSDTASRNDRKGLEIRLKKTSRDLLNLLIPIAAALVLLADPIIAILFQRGNFTQRSTDLVSATFIGYSLVLIASPVTTLIINTFTAFKKTYITFIVSICSIILNYLFNSIFMEKYGVMGIAISTSLVSVINACVLYLLQLKVFRIHFLDVVNFLKTAACVLILFFGCYFLRDIMRYELWTVLTICLFSAMIIMLNKTSVMRIVNKLRGFIERKKS